MVSAWIVLPAFIFKTLLFLAALYAGSAHALTVEVAAPDEIKALLMQHLETARAARLGERLDETNGVKPLLYKTNGVTKPTGSGLYFISPPQNQRGQAFTLYPLCLIFTHDPPAPPRVDERGRFSVGHSVQLTQPP